MQANILQTKRFINEKKSKPLIKASFAFVGLAFSEATTQYFTKSNLDL